MVIAEAYAFSYILAMYQSQNISKSEQEMIAYGIAVMLSILLVAFAHFAGHELYVSSKIRYIRRQWELVDDANQHLVMHPISLEDNQKKDESEPHYNRMLNRIQNDKPHYIISIITLLLVLTVAFSAAALRWEDFSHHKAIEASETKSTGSDFDAQPALAAPVDSDDPFAAEPKAPASAEAKPAQQGNSDAGEAKATGTLIADVLLSIIFAALQVLGVILGWHWGFAGKESAVAYARLLGRRSSTYSTFEELVDDWKAIQNVAQSKLNTLQQKLNAYAHRVKMDGGVGKAHDQNNQTPKTFNDYLEMALESEKKTENIINGTTPKLITHVKESKAKK
jgi:hypothetical protein